MLEVKQLSAGYGGNDVVFDASFHIETGEVVMIIGSNGAGKTTLFKAMSGMIPASKGNVTLNGQEIGQLPTEEIARLGMSFVPAERHLFPRMTVRENLVLGAYPHRPDPDTLASILALFPRLEERLTQHAGTMSGGEQQMLAVGRALMSKPRLLVLDEPSTGLAPLLAQAAYEALRVLQQRGMTILVAEQQVPLAMSISDRGYVLENGRISLQGTTKELAANPGVRSAYLGVS